MYSSTLKPSYVDSLPATAYSVQRSAMSGLRVSLLSATVIRDLVSLVVSIFERMTWSFSSFDILCATNAGCPVDDSYHGVASLLFSICFAP